MIETYQNLVVFFGNQVKTAKALRVSQPNVSHYLNGKQFMSEKVARRAERATCGKFKAIDLCPSLKEEMNEETENP